MMKKYGKGAKMFAPPVEPVFADLSEVKDLQSIEQKLVEAKDAFMKVPANIRRRFDNKPLKMIEFLNEPDNLEESYKIGLRVRPDPEENIKIDLSDETIEAIKNSSENPEGTLTS